MTYRRKDLPVAGAPVVLVTGATGRQGGAVARSLLEDGWRVRALVRDAADDRARLLADQGAELAVGDLDDEASLRTAMDGAHGVFSVQPSDLADPRPELEVRRGRNVADAARATGVAHLVYSSAAAAGRGSGVAHFESKAEIEAYVRDLGVPATVLRPVYFMENWTSTVPEALADGGERVGSIALDPGTPLQMVAVADIGRIAAEAFRVPDEFAGATVDVAGDELTVRRVAEVLSAVDGVPTRLERLPDDELWARSAEVAKMFRWIGCTGFEADLPALRERHPGLLTFEAWLTAGRTRS